MGKVHKVHFTYQQVIALVFFAIILLGGILLSLPISARNGEITPFVDAIFTSASATCVTGLVLHDTYTHWSLFGQFVILLLIQVGGIGFMTVATLFSFFMRRKIGLRERVLISEAINSLSIGGIVRLTSHILIGTFICEGFGAALLALRFCPEMGLGEGLFSAVFHSVSAFCNAGFDLMGRFGQYSSLTRYAGDPLVNLVVIALIIIGGVGFLVWEDLYTYRLSFHKYQLHTKIVLVTSGLLILIPAALILITEYNHGFAGFGMGKSLLTSLFQAVTPRTAGFNTVGLSGLRESTVLLLMVLMLIGGSPGSTAGGIKTTTFMVVLMSAAAAIKNRKDLCAFKRRLDENALRRASAVVFIYMSVAAVSSMVIACMQNFPATDTVFEVLSAMGTVGLSLGLTPLLCTASKVIVAFLMYFGRVGVLSIAMSLSRTHENVPVQYPNERIMIG